MRLHLLPALLGLAACVPSLDERCSPGECATGLVCDEGYCVPAAQGDAEVQGELDVGRRDARADDGAPPPDAASSGDEDGESTTSDGRAPGPICGDGQLDEGEACDHPDDPHCERCALLEPVVGAGRHPGYVQAGSHDIWRIEVDGAWTLRVAVEGDCEQEASLRLEAEGEAPVHADGACPAVELHTTSPRWDVTVRGSAALAYSLVVELEATCGDGVVEGDELCDGGEGCFACQPSVCGAWDDGVDGCTPPPLADCPEEVALPSGCLPALPCPDGWVREPEGGCAPPGPAEGCAEGQGLPGGGCLPEWACPDGWVQATPYGCRLRPLACPNGKVANLSECTPVQPECEEWWDRGRDAVYVRAGSAGQLDGSFQAPYGDLGEALLALGERTRVYLAPGRYPLGQTLPPSVEILGTCAAEVTIAGTLRVAAGNRASLEGLTLHGGDARALEVEPQTAVTLRSVDILGASGVQAGRGAGLVLRGVRTDRVAGAWLASTGAVVVDAEDSLLGSGAVSRVEGTVRLTDSVLLRGPLVVLGELRVTGTRLTSPAVVEGDGGRLTVSDSVCTGSPDGCFEVRGGVAADLTRLHVATALFALRSGPARDDDAGAPDIHVDALHAERVETVIDVASPATVQVTRLGVGQASGRALSVGAASPGVRVTGYAVDATSAPGTIAVTGAANVTLADGVVTRWTGPLLRVDAGGAEVAVEGLVGREGAVGLEVEAGSLTSTDLTLEGLQGSALAVADGASLTASRAFLAGVGGTALAAGGAVAVDDARITGHEGAAAEVAGRLTLTDVQVDGGGGVHVSGGALTVQGLEARGLDEAAVRLDGGEVEGEGLVVDGGPLGLAVGAGQMEIERAHLAGSGVGAAVAAEGSLVLRDAVVAGGRLGVLSEGALRLEDARVQDASVAGVGLYAGSAELSWVAFLRNAVGLVRASGVELIPGGVVHHAEQATDELECDEDCPGAP